jgi:hypothetical protein
MGRDSFEDLVVDGWTILEWILKKYTYEYEGVDWINLAQDRAPVANSCKLPVS